MARPKEHGAETRDRLLRAAGEALASGGAASLSVRALADEVGVSTRAIYSLFGSKEGVVRAMFNAGFAGLAEELASVDTTDPLERLRGLAMAYRRSALARPHLYAVMFDCPVPEFEPSADDEAVALTTLGCLRDAVRDAVDAGAVHGDVETITFGMWGLTHGLASLELAGPPPDVDTDDVWATAVDAMLAGLVSDANR